MYYNLIVPVADLNQLVDVDACLGLNAISFLSEYMKLMAFSSLSFLIFVSVFSSEIMTISRVYFRKTFA
jgi:hypothetical protein